MEIRKPYSEQNRTQVYFHDLETGEPQPSVTEQHHRPQTNVNTILAKYDKTGLITHVNAAQARYGNFTAVNEYQESLNQVIQAKKDFEALPSAIRKRFANDPGEFFEFATDPSNEAELIKLGLAEAKPQPETPGQSTKTVPETE